MPRFIFLNESNQTGQKGYFNHTLKKQVLRNTKTAAQNIWRVLVMAKAYEVCTTTVKKYSPFAATSQFYFDSLRHSREREETTNGAVNQPFTYPIISDYIIISFLGTSETS